MLEEKSKPECKVRHCIIKTGRDFAFSSGKQRAQQSILGFFYLIKFAHA